MRRLYVALLSIGLLVALMPPALADHDGDTYLALGDSIPAGFRPGAPPITDDGYPNIVAKRLGLDLVNLSCPGDDTAEMRTGEGSACYREGASQIQAAVDYLSAHPGAVELITITIGANDVLECDLTDPEVETCVINQLGQISNNLPLILLALRTAAPGVPIVAMNYYNPQVALWIVDPAVAEASLQLTGPFNGTLESIYGAYGVPVADVESAFKTLKTNGTIPQNVRAACMYTLMCEQVGPDLVLSDFNPTTEGLQPDIHPTEEGHRRIASTFTGLIEGLGLLGD